MLPLLTDTSGEVDQALAVPGWEDWVDISSLCQTPFGNPRSFCLSFLKKKGGVFFLSSLKIGSQMGVSWAMNLLMYCSLLSPDFFLCLWYRHADNCFGFCRSTSIYLLLTINPSSLLDEALNLLPALYAFADEDEDRISAICQTLSSNSLRL